LVAIVVHCAGPAGGQPKPPDLDPEVAEWVRDLADKTPARREAAAREIGRHVARPAPPAVMAGLCQALVDSPKETRLVLLDAVAELAPAVAKSLTKINASRGPDMLTKHQRTVVEAIDALANEGAAAAPAEVYLRDVLKSAKAGREPGLDRPGLGAYATDTVTGACLRAFRKVKARDQATVEMVADMAVPGSRFPAHVRQDAIGYVGEAAADPDLGRVPKDVLTAKAVALFRPVIERDPACRVAALKAAAQLGGRAEPLESAAKRFTGSTDEATRDAAKELLRIIESADK
jgi:hypothetical protein